MRSPTGRCIAQTGVPASRDAACVPNRCPCRARSSFKDFPPSIALPVLVYLLHDGVPFLIVRQCSLGAKEALSRFASRRRRNCSHRDFDLLALGYFKVFIQFDGLAAYLAM